MVKWLNGYMVKFVRLPFYERSEMKRLSRTNPALAGCLPRYLGGLPRESGACPETSWVKLLC